jgi:hypothetical protein
VKVDFDQQDGAGEGQADREQRGDHRHRQPDRAEQRLDDRDAQERPVVKRDGDRIDRAFRHRPPPAERKQCHDRDDHDAPGQRGGHRRLPQAAPVRLGDELEEQHRQREVDGEAVERRDGVRREQPGAPGQPADQDDREDGQNDGEDGEHRGSVRADAALRNPFRRCGT